MNADQQIVVRVTPDGKQYIYWVETLNASRIPANADANKTTSGSTLATNVQNELPTLST